MRAFNIVGFVILLSLHYYIVDFCFLHFSSYVYFWHKINTTRHVDAKMPMFVKKTKENIEKGIVVGDDVCVFIFFLERLCFFFFVFFKNKTENKQNERRDKRKTFIYPIKKYSITINQERMLKENSDKSFQNGQYIKNTNSVRNSDTILQ